MYRYSIQKQVLPIRAAADFYCLSGTSELLSRILAPFLHCPLISFFFFHFFSTRVDSLHLSCTCPIFLSPVEVTQLQTFLFTSVDLPFHWFMISTVFCVIIFVSCPTIKPTGVLPVGCKQYVPVLLCATKLAQNMSQYYFVLQSLHKVLPSTTSYY